MIGLFVGQVKVIRSRGHCTLLGILYHLSFSFLFFKIAFGSGSFHLEIAIIMIVLCLFSLERVNYVKHTDHLYCNSSTWHYLFIIFPLGVFVYKIFLSLPFLSFTMICMFLRDTHWWLNKFERSLKLRINICVLHILIYGFPVVLNILAQYRSHQAVYYMNIISAYLLLACINSKTAWNHSIQILLSFSMN